MSFDILNGVDLPSFLLGFVSCIFLYFISPGFVLILGGLVSFFKVLFLILIAAFAAFLVVYTKGQDDRKVHGLSQESTPTPIQASKSGDGGVKYFNIPITKEKKAANVQRTPFPDSESAGMSFQESDVYEEKIHTKTRRRRSVYSVDTVTERGACKKAVEGVIPNKTIRYDNFVRMAGKKRPDR
ncbi:uncharacterized protein KNAG_0H03340 [Huiozyma naganishii CBS 8797]|uniref:Uncharacterized protein n=1 Tax=Huiozyma naganishii (strain ATCC MYA-139 / BCRC 22969 / CBS 8797 / KCTC 17520 / NBRC 10181 / NCYC 3082 / Yp74L-3) TaxID=1071383 RepID=J7RPS9_HUIN7|nr:hypothetical protein KNAG_0H03340 [Kazachstania naganishii CBS 8797]CCK71748.1 hypothetical protein KNAG_0H03340 [Kazachstania naganishii CBS 8797]